MSQLSYSIDIGAVAFPGQKADIGLDDVISAIASENIPYGVAVALDSGEYPKLLGKLPTADTDVILGIAVADQNRAQNPAVAQPTYLEKSAVGLMKQGRIYVKVGVGGAAVTGGQVYVRHASGQLGEITSIDDGNTVALAGAKFLSNAAAGEFAVVELDIV